MRPFIIPALVLVSRAALGWEIGVPFRDCPDCPEMVPVPAGAFIMGDACREGGPHRETIAKPFAIGRFEITRGQFATFVAETGHEPVAGCQSLPEDGPLAQRTWRDPGFDQTDDHPVVCVDIGDAHAFTAWLSRRVGAPYRPPTAAEWEYAARAGTTTRFPWGDAPDRAAANFVSRTTVEVRDITSQVLKMDYDGHAEGGDRWLYTAPVGSFPANRFGLFDTAGNVEEMATRVPYGAECLSNRPLVTCARGNSRYPGVTHCTVVDVATKGEAPINCLFCRLPDTCSDYYVYGGGWSAPPWAMMPSRRWQPLVTPHVPREGWIGFRVVRELR